MEGQDLAEWVAYYGIEPWGEERADLRIANLSSMFANVHKSRDAKKFTPDMFIYGRTPEVEKVVQAEDYTWQLETAKVHAEVRRKQLEKGAKNGA